MRISDWSSDVCSSDLAEAHLGLVVRGHKGALALPAQQKIFSGQLIDGLAHRTLADLKTSSQLEFAGYGFARLPVAPVETLQQQTLDLLVPRAERSPAGCAFSDLPPIR